MGKPQEPAVQRIYGGERGFIGENRWTAPVREIDFMVKLLRACVGMPRRKQAKKDVVSCEKPRGAANKL